MIQYYIVIEGETISEAVEKHKVDGIPRKGFNTYAEAEKEILCNPQFYPNASIYSKYVSV